ncbi:hypothetical protein [Tessaracoccus sp. ZS01]|uniref:hypothetical protein n=1 Tax=Tessaracoccus sp. ZS01 TaxID=1906324 RepID=UPI00096DDAFA|nr:hypothetical protein [Tessaracoccus sp. ZS01]MCG6567526.1 hypothetical protein [Tessaracoccus sp. ZS01]OMG55892.1 hypothetical protein BJN44_07825 [Tessaracoccus sp. ZS01]
MTLRTTLTVLAAAAMFAVGVATPAQAAPVAPVARVACPSAEAVSATWGGKLTRTEVTTTSCRYQRVGGDAYDGFTVSVSVGTPAEAKAALAAGWPVESPYPFSPAPVPALGADAFKWADASPAFYYWTFAPGALATMAGNTSSASSETALIATAKLFKPMLEVYTVPGERTVNSRQWRTTCEPYSATARCRTEIWASVITLKDGRYLKTDGWAFNSLTYRWSDRALWKNNPLGNTTTGWTATDGRRWRTECDTATTGRGACRSYIQATVISTTVSGYRQETTWVFNNQVLFNQ